MANHVHSKQVIPSARRLIRSLRNMGYDFAAAVADLVDNSINANADEISIDVDFDGDHSKIRITDNGTGMNAAQLEEAMRYGSQRDYDEDNDLGKFGLGLKTASLSQCEKISVASREIKGNEINAFCWDLAHIESTDKWELTIPSTKDLNKIVNGELNHETGTVVLWERLDRMLGQKHPYGDSSRKRLAVMSRELEDHLSMVFHRYIDGEVPGRQVKIMLSGNELKSWDPYVKSEPATKKLDLVEFTFEHNDRVCRFTIQPYILPPKDKFSSLQEWERASGPRKWNFQQGFYIYRANRMIQSGGWSNLRAPDEHTKLARIALDFSPQLDDAFGINVAKMKVQLPKEVRDQMESEVGKISGLARKSYDKKGSDSLSVKPKTKPSAKSGVKLGKAASGNEQSVWTLNQIQKMLEDSAFEDELPVVLKVIQRLRRKLKI